MGDNDDDDDKGHFIFSNAALAIAILCALAAIIASGINIYGHLYYFRFPELQRPIIRYAKEKNVR